MGLAQHLERDVVFYAWNAWAKWKRWFDWPQSTDLKHKNVAELGGADSVTLRINGNETKWGWMLGAGA
jgi:hypothetical protein